MSSMQYLSAMCINASQEKPSWGFYIQIACLKVYYALSKKHIRLSKHLKGTFPLASLHVALVHMASVQIDKSDHLQEDLSFTNHPWNHPATSGEKQEGIKEQSLGWLHFRSTDGMWHVGKLSEHLWLVINSNLPGIFWRLSLNGGQSAKKNPKKLMPFMLRRMNMWSSWI